MIKKLKENMKNCNFLLGGGEEVRGSKCLALHAYIKVPFSSFIYKSTFLLMHT